MARQRIKKPPMSQINVVPYIDVMLVLLIIFMVTAPLITEGVKVDLPQASAKPLPPDETAPVVVTVDPNGDLFVAVGQTEPEPVDDSTLVARVAAVLRNRPDTPVVVRGDRQVAYNEIMRAMVLLQQAGAPSVGLMTQPPPER